MTEFSNKDSVLLRVLRSFIAHKTHRAWDSLLSAHRARDVVLTGLGM